MTVNSGAGMDWHGAIRDWNGARKVGRSCVPNVIYHNRRNGRRFWLWKNGGMAWDC